MPEIKTTVNSHFPNSKEIPINSVQIKEEVRTLCEKNHCGNYNKNWTCPPAVGSLEESERKFKQYTKFILLYDVYQVKNSFDYEGMMEGIKEFNKKLLELKNNIESTGNDNFMILGAGGCSLCEKCSYIDGDQCRRPSDSIISCEAHGIDVMSLMVDNGLKYNNGVNTITYIAGVLY